MPAFASGHPTASPLRGCAATSPDRRCPILDCQPHPTATSCSPSRLHGVMEPATSYSPLRRGAKRLGESPTEGRDRTALGTARCHHPPTAQSPRDLSRSAGASLTDAQRHRAEFGIEEQSVRAPRQPAGRTLDSLGGLARPLLRGGRDALSRLPWPAPSPASRARCLDGRSPP